MYANKKSVIFQRSGGNIGDGKGSRSMRNRKNRSSRDEVVMNENGFYCARIG